jgi:hypothetical protein
MLLPMLVLLLLRLSTQAASTRAAANFEVLSAATFCRHSSTAPLSESTSTAAAQPESRLQCRSAAAAAAAAAAAEHWHTAAGALR